MPEQEPPSGVGAGPKQDGETRNRKWGWVEAEVWTERMLAALEKGVKGGKWFSLIDKVYHPAALRAAWRKVRSRKGAAGVDGQDVRRFEARAEAELERLHRQLKRGGYQPQAVRRRWIDKPGTGKKRPLGIPTVRDRVVQTALRQALEPIFEAEFRPESYGFRPGRGCKDPLRRVDELLAEGHHWVVDADIESFFDRIDHETLMEEVQRKVSDGQVLRLLRGYLGQQVLDGLERWTPREGTPQGAVISPLLANVYLHPVDAALEAQGHLTVRYADDVVILCRSQERAEQARSELERELAGRGLRLNPAKTRLVDAREPGGFDFLGYHFERGRKWPRKRSLKRLRERIRPLTRRTGGHSLQRTIETINPILRGWFEYFRHSLPNTFANVDGWVRMRLRSMLRKRRKGRGRGRGSDHQRWSNAFFAAQGLFTMTAAHAVIRQSRCGPH